MRYRVTSVIRIHVLLTFLERAKMETPQEHKNYNDIQTELRDISNRMLRLKGDIIHFPELVWINKDVDPEYVIYKVASTIAKHGNQDKGHKISYEDVAALIQYIADMM